MHRGVRASKQLRVSFSFGVAVGSIGTLLALYEDDAGRRLPTPHPDARPSLPHQDTVLVAHPATRFGFPSLSNVKVREGYVLGYDRRLRNAAWVAEYITVDSLKKSDDVNRLKAAFKADTSTPEAFRVSPGDYLNSGYDRGHLAPARDMMSSSQESVNESFLMTNISPQVGKGFNRGYWSRFEGFVRHIASSYGGAYVVTGPLFLPTRAADSDTYEVRYPVLGTPGNAIAVPTHFFKVVLVQKPSGEYLAAGFILPNQSIPDQTNLTDFLRPIEYIESVSGLLFFDQLRHVPPPAGGRPVATKQLCNDIACTLPAAVEYKNAVASKSKGHQSH
ncbi:hypothetical protein H310_06483 [Aphanomyces invadans]|uniref:Endonuclease n=1 Tax=Aphanomyces invadans TaxID=157072 RepID=A0A024U6S1_9STRA|nr:hypothetical protein H310_06483 [Aphanomyces invadans]ETW01954.1 hypothetical protein H310_06483 [Aphanomyces invadans]|eukprot:XP_008869802.1 hypothetical protein H310_06483 [Aphanomyces invadans]